MPSPTREDHPDTLTSMANLALTYMKQGRLDAAEELGVQVMELRKMKLGEDHPDTLTSMHNLAFTWKEIGRSVHAIALLEECVQSQKRILGANHPNTLLSCSTLTTWRIEAEGQGWKDVDADKEDQAASLCGIITS